MLLLGLQCWFRFRLLPLLDEVAIFDCPQMLVFTPGMSTAPKLKYIQTRLGIHSPECGLNANAKTTVHNQSLDDTSSYPATTSEGIPWSLHTLIKLVMENNRSIEKIFPSNVLLRLQKLEEIHVSWCDLVEDVLEALEAGIHS